MKLSIRRRLLAILLSITLLVWLFTLVESYHETQHEIDELFDAQLAQSARTLLMMAGHELVELDGIPEVAHIHFLPQNNDEDDSHEYEYKLAYQLWVLPQNKLVLRSFMAPEEPLSVKQDGYSTELIRGEPWRIFSLYDPANGFQIKMGESLTIRGELSDEIALQMVVPMLIALPLLTLLIYFGIGRGLQPLHHLTKTIRMRQPGHLERVDTHATPSEIIPLIDALNQLFERVEQGMEKERRFTADAAHELRTPLAALKVQAQVAQRSQDAGEQQHAIEQLGNGIDRTSRLVEQLLTLARIDPDTAQQASTHISLRAVAEELIATLEPQARDKGITLQLLCEGSPTIHGQPESIAIALRNLVDNAIRYTPPGGSIEIALEELEGCVQLHVADSGPGIPEAEHEKVFQRFYRLAGQEVKGSGLGLSIVQRIAELHHASISLQPSRLGGVTITLTFPAIGG